MSARIPAFLSKEGWSGAALAPIAGDASARSYARMVRPDGARAVLMDDPAGPEPVRRFAAVAGRLEAAGLRPPAILAAAPDAGLMLLEDLGDDLMSARLDRMPEAARGLYLAATDMLLGLRSADPAGLPPFGPEEMADAADLAWTEWAGENGRAPWRGPLREALEAHAGGRPVTILRDCHAGNLICQGQGDATVLRVIDFQDAMAGPDGYDLISLLQDARRDVPRDAASAALARWRAATGDGADALTARLAALGAQRALRILGVFARLARGGKDGYLAHAPRVHAHLAANLAHPSLAALRETVRLPAAPA